MELGGGALPTMGTMAGAVSVPQDWGTAAAFDDQLLADARKFMVMTGMGWTPGWKELTMRRCMANTPTIHFADGADISATMLASGRLLAARDELKCFGDGEGFGYNCEKIFSYFCFTIMCIDKILFIFTT